MLCWEKSPPGGKCGYQPFGGHCPAAALRGEHRGTIQADSETQRWVELWCCINGLCISLGLDFNATSAVVLTFAILHVEELMAYTIALAPHRMA